MSKTDKRNGAEPPRVEGKPITSPDDTMAVALSLAKAGWPVFPVKLVPWAKGDEHGVDKRPLVRWLEGATTDLEQIATWWGAEFPGAWVGVHAARAGIVVVDLDLDKGKGAGRENLRAAGHDLPRTFKYRTRSGGHHHVYRAPKGIDLTIAKGHPVPGVDIRAGNGLMVYYGPALTEAPTLAKAPKWALVEPSVTYTRGSGDIDSWLARTVPGKPTKAVRAAEAMVERQGTEHDTMLAAVSELIKRGSERGAGQAFERARTTYLADYPDFERHWDNAAAGSIAQHGMPPTTLELTKPERKAIKARNKPKAIEAEAEQRKREYRVKVHAERSDTAGARVLEDGPLSVELAAAMADHWAWTKGRGLMRYTGKVWAEAEPHALVEEVRARLDDIEVEEHEAAVYRGDNKGIDKARTLLSRNRARAVSDLVVGRLALKDKRFDAHPHLLNVQNGVVDLRTSTLLPHDPALYLTKIAAAEYHPDADMTTWSRALTALPPKTAAWLKVRFGQAATGSTPDDDMLVILEGAGENGKTTVIHAPRVTLGDHSTRVPARLLDADPGDHPTTLMTLMGARLAIVEELPEGRNLNVKRLKDAVGTPEITARRMRQDDVTFEATHALFLSTNYLPIVAETDHGTWRRLALVRFPYRYVKRRKLIKSDRDRKGDTRLKRALATPNDGVLRWLVEGAREWYDAGMRMPEPPKRVRRDTEAWRLDADPVLGYLDERIARDESSAITSDDLANDFNDHLERRGHRRWSAQTINARFEGHVGMAGIERKQVKFGRIQPSRPPFSVKPIPPSTKAWVGIRFKVERVVPMSPEVAAMDERLRGG